jgi:hypothetical protein
MIGSLRKSTVIHSDKSMSKGSIMVDHFAQSSETSEINL